MLKNLCDRFVDCFGIAFHHNRSCFLKIRFLALLREGFSKCSSIFIRSKLPPNPENS
ncbi:unnamed protein product [Moneuplotes crassus]|uniref:Uncharacterized protein n=1 Tax=Euplotes crassus TaxID=5936 RepID=A0AAD1XZX8_EUPCR|nr:unnamed protein product [Moneuplotes crassus]